MVLTSNLRCVFLASAICFVGLMATMTRPARIPTMAIAMSSSTREKPPFAPVFAPSDRSRAGKATTGKEAMGGRPGRVEEEFMRAPFRYWNDLPDKRKEGRGAPLFHSQ